MPALVAQGIGIWIGVQAFINMGVNMGLLPTKGLTLPLMSFGGSGILANCVALAILLRVRLGKSGPELHARQGHAGHPYECPVSAEANVSAANVKRMNMSGRSQNRQLMRGQPV